MIDWLGDMPLWIFGFLIAAGFIAGYVDAIAGGGGMVQTLALLMAGIPPVNVIATNKMASVAGTTIAVLKYHHAKQIPWRWVAYCAIPCLIASAIGSKLVILLPDNLILFLLIICIPIALFFMMKKPRKAKASQHVQQNTAAKSQPLQDKWRAIALLSPVAFYDGLIGPGTGAYMAIAGNRGLGLSFLSATGLAKPLNLCTNVGSLIVFILAAKVVWLVAIPMAGASMLGAYIGSHSAIKYGDSFIKKIIVLMLAIMLIINVAKLVLT